MPHYDYACLACGHVQEEWCRMSKVENASRCEKCGARSERIFSTQGNTVVFRKRWFEHIAPEPVFIESQAQLKKVCKENNSYIVSDDRVKGRRYREKMDRYKKKHKARVGR